MAAKTSRTVHSSFDFRLIDEDWTKSFGLPLPRNEKHAQAYNFRLLSGFGVVSIGLRDQGGDKSAEQGLSAAAGVMHELEEAEIERQLLL